MIAGDLIMAQAPAISVVMPVFNAARYLAAAMDSVLSQSMGEFEFLIFDDGSTDGSPEILKRYAAADPRIKLHLGQHQGLTFWLNEGITMARGRYIARMDADDISLPQRFAIQFAAMEKDPDVVVVGGQSLWIDPDGDVICASDLPLNHEKIDGYHMEGQPGMLLHPATMIRRDAVVKIGQYRDKFELIEDLDLWLRLAEVGRLANLPDRVLQYRQHPRSTSQLNREKQFAMLRTVIQEAVVRRKLPHREVQIFYPPANIDSALEYASLARRTGYWKTSRKYALRQFRKEPLRLESITCFARAYSGRPGKLMERLVRRLTPGKS